MVLKKRVTIQDIADKAKVSKSTVSRVLNATTPVAPEKETAVLEAMAELDYQPNIFARGLARGQSLTIGVLTQNVGSPFYDTIMRGIIEGLEGTDYSPIFVDGRWQEAVEQRALQTLLDRRVDGLITVGGTLSGEQLSQIDEQVPVIVAARDVPELAGRCIYADNVAGAYAATQHLIYSGHRQIAHITGLLSQQDGRRRQEGFARAMADNGLEVNEQLVVEGNFRRQAGVIAAETLLTRGEPFTAIFAGNDQMAAGARLAFYRRGIRVPEEISLIGYDDEPNSAYMTPPLSTVHQPAEEIGRGAAQGMLQLLNGEDFEAPILQPTLRIRDSVSRIR